MQDKKKSKKLFKSTVINDVNGLKVEIADILWLKLQQKQG